VLYPASFFLLWLFLHGIECISSLLFGSFLYAFLVLSFRLGYNAVSRFLKLFRLEGIFFRSESDVRYSRFFFEFFFCQARMLFCRWFCPAFWYCSFYLSGLEWVFFFCSSSWLSENAFFVDCFRLSATEFLVTFRAVRLWFLPLLRWNSLELTLSPSHPLECFSRRHKTPFAVNESHTPFFHFSGLRLSVKSWGLSIFLYSMRDFPFFLMFSAPDFHQNFFTAWTLFWGFQHISFN